MDIKVPAGSGGGGGGLGGNRDGGNRNKRASRDNRNQPQQPNDDDWSTVTSRSGRNENFKSFDVQKLQKTRDADNISLGPSRAGWGKGSGIYSGSKPQNRFAAAANLDVGPPGGGQGGPPDSAGGSANQQASRYHQSSQSMGSNFNRNNSRNERQETLDFARQRFGNTNGPTNNVMGPSPTPKDAQPGPQQVAGGPSMSMDGHNLPGNLPVPNNKNEGAMVMLQTNQLKVCNFLLKRIIFKKNSMQKF